MSIKVLYDNIIFELQHAGGISNVWYNLIKQINNKRNINLSFIEGSKINNIFRNKININDDKIINDKLYPLIFRRFIHVQNKNNFDIYHSSYFRPLKLKAVNKTKVVLTVHDFIYEKFNSYLTRKVHVFFKNRALKQADIVICVSDSTKTDFINFYPNFNPKKIKVVYNGVDEIFKPIQKKQNININGLHLNNQNFLLYVGNRGYCKNFNFVLKIFHQLPSHMNDFNLICIGGVVHQKENK